MSRINIILVMTVWGLLASCSQEDVNTPKKWDINNNSGDMNLVTEDSSVDLKDFEHSDCVHRGSTVLRNKVDIEKISNIKCNIFDGNIKINLIDGSNSIASLGSINTIKGDLIIGDFEEGGSFNEELKNIDGFLGLLSVEKLIIQDAPMIYNLDVFYNLGEIEEIYVPPHYQLYERYGHPQSIKTIELIFEELEK